MYFNFDETMLISRELQNVKKRLRLQFSFMRDETMQQRLVDAVDLELRVVRQNISNICKFYNFKRVKNRRK